MIIIFFLFDKINMVIIMTISTQGARPVHPPFEGGQGIKNDSSFTRVQEEFSPKGDCFLFPVLSTGSKKKSNSL
jgi:hypothetical protein